MKKCAKSGSTDNFLNNRTHVYIQKVFDFRLKAIVIYIFGESEMHDGMTRKIVLKHRFNCVIKVICSFEGNCTINLSYKRARSNGQMIRHSLDDVCRVCRQ